MGKDKSPEIREILPVDVTPERIARAKRYMDRMARAANSGDLADNTLIRLQRPSPTVLNLGLPNLVLWQGLDGVWRVTEWGKPEAVNTEAVNTPPVNTDPVNTEADAAPDVNTPSDRKAYMRDYMRKRRAQDKDSTDA